MKHTFDFSTRCSPFSNYHALTCSCFSVPASAPPRGVRKLLSFSCKESFLRGRLCRGSGELAPLSSSLAHLLPHICGSNATHTHVHTHSPSQHDHDSVRCGGEPKKLHIITYLNKATRQWRGKGLISRSSGRGTGEGSRMGLRGEVGWEAAALEGSRRSSEGSQNEGAEQQRKGWQLPAAPAGGSMPAPEGVGVVWGKRERGPGTTAWRA